eukprot:TRINITY_DN6279_c0_g1_i1.p1 TRINITY_DN6279_c0_g1~~TRINITY_DN6279_c0_g1_i1.p1  ORF type:complete len:100 (+),score=7.25 TRINITY_DN6279_c0_g1_i1:13-312(+)
MEPKKDEEMKDLIKNNANLIYRTTNQQIGSAALNLPEKSKKGIDGRFTNHLSYAGMYRANGLATKVDNDRFIDGSKDWMDKLAQSLSVTSYLMHISSIS